MRADHDSFKKFVTLRKPYSPPALEPLGTLSDVQIRMANSGPEGVRSVFDLIIAKHYPDHSKSRAINSIR